MMDMYWQSVKQMFYDFHCYFIHFILKWLINERDVIIMDNNQTQHFPLLERTGCTHDLRACI